MLDIKRIRENLEDIKKAMDRRGEKEFDLDAVVELDDQRRELLKEVEALKSEMNIEQKKIPQLMKEGKKEEAEAEKVKLKELSEKIKGLDEGTYNVKQTKASNGYFISAKSYKINIKDSNLDGVLEEENSITFFNSKIFALPVTGGNGIVMLIGLGTILIGIGIALIVSINKKRKILKNN